MKTKIKKSTKAVKSSGLSVTVGSALDTLDLMRDEFIRIMCLPCTDEVNGICERALKGITMKTPILQEVSQLREEVIRLRNDAARMTWLEDNGVCTPVGVRGGDKYERITRERITREWIDHQLL